MSAERRRGRHAKPARHVKSGRDGKSARHGKSARDGKSGRHGKSARDGIPARDGAAAERARSIGDRLTIAVAAAAAGLVAVSVVVFAGGPKRPASTDASRAASKAAASRARSAAPRAATASAAGAAHGDSDADPGAIAYYKEKDPRDKVVRHVDEVRWSGRYLRVYTDLKEGDTRSHVALDLCKWTSDYLTGRRGDHDSVVFVHARRNDNGNVVLVNKLSSRDSCKSVETL